MRGFLGLGSISILSRSSGPTLFIYLTNLISWQNQIRFYLEADEALLVREVVCDTERSEQIEHGVGAVKVTHQHSDMGQEHDRDADVIKNQVLVHFIYLPA